MSQTIFTTNCIYQHNYFLAGRKPICYRIQHKVIFFVVLKTKIPNFVYLNFQLSSPENISYCKLLSYCFFFPEILLTFLVRNSRVAEFTSCVSNRKLHISDCCTTGFGVDQTILPIHFLILFLREKVCCRKWYSQGTKVSVHSHKNFHHKGHVLWLIGPTDWTD